MDNRERLNEIGARAVACVDVDLARLDDELAVIVVEAEVALVERERDRSLLAGGASVTRSKPRSRRTGCEMLATGSWRYSCTTSSPVSVPVFSTSTEAVIEPSVGTLEPLKCRFVIENVV